MVPSRRAGDDHGTFGQSLSSAESAGVGSVMMGEVFLWWTMNGKEGRKSERPTVKRREIIRN